MSEDEVPSLKWFGTDLGRYPSQDKVFKACFKMDEDATTVLALIREGGEVEHYCKNDKNPVLKYFSKIVQVGQHFAFKKHEEMGAICLFHETESKAESKLSVYFLLFGQIKPQRMEAELFFSKVNLSKEHLKESEALECLSTAATLLTESSIEDYVYSGDENEMASKATSDATVTAADKTTVTAAIKIGRGRGRHPKVPAPRDTSPPAETSSDLRHSTRIRKLTGKREEEEEEEEEEEMQELRETKSTKRGASRKTAKAPKQPPKPPAKPAEAKPSAKTVEDLTCALL